MEIIAPPVIDLAKSAVVPASRHIGYLFRYKKYVNDLRKKVEDNLLMLEDDIKIKVISCRDNGDVIHNVVQHWLEKVDKVRDEVAEMCRQAEKINSCFKGWLSARYRLGKESSKKIAIVEDLLTEGRRFDVVATSAPVPLRVVEHFDAFASRETIKKELIQALADVKTNLVGVYGMEGVGKTSLVKEVCQEVEKLKLFDKVVLVTVSQNVDLKGIQREIAENLDMKIEEDAIPIRAARLSKRLKLEKTILLIFDEVWTRLELAEVGIIPYRDDQNTCKVLITSRNLDVCHSMETTKNIEVQGFSERDSMELFLRNVSGVDCNALRKMSEDIVNECEGLPFAILAFARALQDKDEAVWPDIIKQIRKSLFAGMSLFDDLQSKVQNDLVRLETDVKGKVELARNNGDVIHQVVEQWLDNVDRVRTETAELYHEAEKINSCFKGRHSACQCLGDESKKKVDVVDKLLDEGRGFSSVSNPALVPPPVMKHFSAFASREATKKEVIQALVEDKTHLVGVYGMGGVGKTTLMNEIRKQVEKTKLFDKVVLATVSQHPDLRGIQAQIAGSLGMKIEEENISARAARLSARLRHEKSILLMFDDLWTRLELSDVGIDLDEVSVNTCKVIITSRSLDVCNLMGTTKNIAVKVLSKKDSLELFRQEVGDVDSDALCKMSEEITNECDGLPLAIVTLARTLRNKKESFWDAVIQQLKKSMCGGMSPVNASIKLSYKFLETSETKLCFLLCGLFPEDHKFTMDTMVGYAMGEDLLGEVETLREARGNLHIMVDTLISSGLWMKGNIEGYVTMHDIIRDAAISIARENKAESILRAGLGLHKWPELKEPGKCLRMSIMSNDIREVPDTPECSQLVTLSLARNRLLVDFPDGFFEGMKRLATLDLSHIGISSLPKSLSSLKNCLRSLYLDNCWMLEEVSVIGTLKTLEILSLQGTGISRLPEEMSGLTNLKMLNLSETPLTNVPSNLISSLSNLEELYMRESFSGWEIEGTGDNASLVEVASLTNLTTLHLKLENTKWLSTDIGPCPWDKLTKFCINVLLKENEEIIPSHKCAFERCISFGISTKSDSFPVADWVKVLVDRTYELVLDLEDCEGLDNDLVVNLNLKSFHNLKSFKIESADTVEYLVNVVEQVPVTMFPQLETLDLFSVYELKAIWKGPLVKRSFEKLKLLKISCCGRLVNILPSRLWRNLQNLEGFEIENCENLEKVFDSKGFEDGSATIVQLRTIKLEELPGVISIWEGAIPLIRLESIKVLVVGNCPELKSSFLFFSLTFAQRFQQLEELDVWECSSFIKLIAEEEEEEIIMLHPNSSIEYGSRNLVSNTYIAVLQPPIFSNLKKLNISSCHGLKCIFPIGIFQGLVQLEEFDVYDCNEMEELSVECLEEGSSMTIRLPCLRDLSLRKLPRLSSFFSHPRILLECPSLETLTIEGCPNLKRLPFDPQSTAKLEKFYIGADELFSRLEWEDLSVKAQLQLILTIPSALMPFRTSQQWEHEEQMEGKCDKEKDSMNTKVDWLKAHPEQQKRNEENEVEKNNHKEEVDRLSDHPEAPPHWEFTFSTQTPAAGPSSKRINKKKKKNTNNKKKNSKRKSMKKTTI